MLRDGAKTRLLSTNGLVKSKKTIFLSSTGVNLTRVYLQGVVMQFTRRIVLSLLIVNGAHAAPVEMVGSQVINANTLNAPTQPISLLKFTLSDQAITYLKKRITKAVIGAQEGSFLSNKPARVQLGMNDMPVLNQGSHGSCVTFANTAAVDAALNKGNYISQLCQLQLGRYFETNGYKSSGWDGTWSPVVLNQMMQFGIINIDKQRKHGCAGLYDYPLRGADPESEMTLEEYHPLSEPLTKVSWSPLLDHNHAFLDRVDTTKILSEIKSTLAVGDRVTFAVLLLEFEEGVAGAVGKHHVSNDTWVLTPEMARDVYLKGEFGGHEMIITGYDDTAIATDSEGRKHKGLLTLRNSWGDKIGNKGNFYMSYDYFTLLVIEAQRIRLIQP